MPLSADVMEDTIDELPGSAMVSPSLFTPSSTIAGTETYNLNTAQSDLAVPSALRATEEAEVFLELGYVDRAIKVLTDDIAAHPRNPPAVWLLLLNIYHQQDNRVAFDEAVAAFSMRFNLIPPTWDSISKPMPEGEGLLAVPHVLAKVVSLWPRPECQDYLSELLYDDRQGTRIGFSLDVYQHIAWLKEVLCMMTRTELAIAEDVQRGNDLDFDLNF
jgi:tetratricopeptide (TPR) repeat protein